MIRFWHWRSLGLFLQLSACSMLGNCAPEPVSDADFRRIYETPLPPAERPLRVYHLGHSLVGQDMPAMLRQLAGGGHSFNSQLGWGTNLKVHWEPDLPINGFADSNGHPEYREPFEALASGEYDAIVLTEAVEIRDSIKYMAPADYLHRWSVAAWTGNPDTRVYLYEVWHELDHPEGWLERLDRDFPLYWEGEILRRALAYDDVSHPIYVIPGGQVMAALSRAVESRGGVGPVGDRHDLFLDDIHFNDYGAYLIALTHYAVLYGRSPVGLPHALLRADGTPADDPGPELARLMQETVWQVVSRYPPSGVAAGG
jgi:hypothetical protein